MSRNFTAGELINRVRLINDYVNLDGVYSDQGSYMSSGTLLNFMDAAHAYAWDLYSDTDEGWNVIRSTVSLSGSSGSLPNDCDSGKIRSVQATQDGGSTYRTLRRAHMTADDSNWDGWTDRESYRLVGDEIEVAPSSGVSSLRLTYVPVAPHLSSSLQEIRGGNGYDQVVVLKTCILARIREDRPYADLNEQLRVVESRFVESISRRDRSLPAVARPRSRVGGVPWRRA